MAPAGRIEMQARPNVLLIITQDTKEEEARFVRRTLEASGVNVIHLDPSIRRTVGGAEIAPETIAGAAGKTIEQVRALGHEGKCQEVMIEGATRLALATHAETPLSGIISVGGSMGTTLATAVMRAFPYGLPKLMVSTMASGFTAPYVGVKDIAMMNAVTDISGINSISREVYRNAALAMAGMANGYDPTGASDRPLVLITHARHHREIGAAGARGARGGRRRGDGVPFVRRGRSDARQHRQRTRRGAGARPSR